MRRATAPNRTSENDIAIAALRVAAAQPSGYIPTRTLKKAIPTYIKLTPADLMPSKTRSKESMWQQIVGNIISHRGEADNIIGMGYAKYINNGIEITSEGRGYLKKLGY